jgi:putative transposase
LKITFNNLYIHFVLTTFNRTQFIQKEYRERIEKYITGIIKRSGSKLYSIYANPEHVHMLISKSPCLSEDYLIKMVADSSAKFINDNNMTNGRFSWQETASAFSVSKSEVKKVCNYIHNQPVHHRKITFDEEYNSLMAFYQENLSKK